VFLPLFEVTLDPDSNPKLANFLNDISGFDSVDAEIDDSETFLQPLYLF
jgi:hypothetical protein